MSLNGFKILVIEDDPMIRESLIDMLDISGYQTFSAQNGKVGIDLINEQKPDLILSDIMMPEMDGFELLKAIRKNKKTELIPIIMLTAKVDLESKLHGLELGADDYLTKPFEFRELQLKINHLLNTRKKIFQLISLNPEESTISSQEEIFLKKIKLLLEENIENANLQVDKLAQHLCMSPSTLQRRVKKITNKSPNQIIKEYRLKKAHEMVKANYGSLSEIAHKSGFNSIAYFSTCYKSFFGNTPKEDLPR